MQPGQVIGGYQIERLLGRGGMGAVFLARRPGGGLVALKLLVPSADPELLARFDREAKVLQRLEAPGIVRCLDYGLERARPYIVQEFCEGGDLSGLLRTRGCLEPLEAASLVQSLCVALEVAHRAGVVHRDLKPANVLLAKSGPKLTDFGLARARGIDHRSLTATGVFLGTPAYMAPEQLVDAREVDQRSDVYALGVILYELLSGTRPFRGPSALAIADAVLHQSPPPLPAELPAGLQRVVTRAMAREPEERFDSAQGLADALSVFTRGEASASAAPRLLTPLLALTGVLALVLVGLFVLGDSAEEPSAPTRALSGVSRPGPSTPAKLAPSPSSSLSLGASPEHRAQPSAPLLPAVASTEGALGQALDDCASSDFRERGLLALEVQADSGEPSAGLAFARLLLAGWGGAPRDPKRARPYLECAVRGGLIEAEFLLGLCSSPRRWSTLCPQVDRGIYERAREGDLPALRFFLGELAPVPTPLLEALTELEPSRRRSLADIESYFRYKTAHPKGRGKTLRDLRSSPSGEAALVRAVLALELPRPASQEADVGGLLERAYAAGLPIAAERLAGAIASGHVIGSKADRERWLRRAAIRGRMSAALQLANAFPEEQGWLRLAAALGDPRAALAYGRALVRAARGFPPEAGAWAEYAAAAGPGPEASAFLAQFLVVSEPARARKLALEGASNGDHRNLAGYAEVLVRSRQGPRDPSLVHALEILAGLACIGDRRAALKAAELSSMLGERELVRPLLRRALPLPSAKATIQKLTRGVPETAPVASQSQLVLEARAGRGDRQALIELGLRARAELQGDERLRAMTRAAETGDLPSRLRLAQLNASQPDRLDRAEVVQECVALGEAGLPGGWLQAYDLTPAKKGAREREHFVKRLRALAEGGDTEGMYALGVILVRRAEDHAEGVRWVGRAAGRGDEKAAGVWTQLLLQGPHAARTLAAFEANPREHSYGIGLAYLEGAGAPRDLTKARRHLLLAALRDGSAQALFCMGRAFSLERDPGPSVASVWLEAADRRGHRDARRVLGALYLKRKDFGRPEVGLAKLESLVEAGWDADALLLLGRAYLEGRGTPRDLPRAERVLNKLRAKVPEARALLATICLATERAEEGRASLERETLAKSPHARVALARCLLEGIGGPREAQRGLSLLHAGAKAGEGPSCEVLGSFYLTGRHVVRDEARGRELLRRARSRSR